MKTFIELFNESVNACWDKSAISQYGNKPLTYGEFAKEICVLQKMWKKAGLKQGEKVAINAKSSVNWMTAFMASVTGGYVSVQLFNGFTPADTQKLVDHSDSRILYTEKKIFSAMDFESMPQLIAAIDTDTNELLASRGNFTELYNDRYAEFSSVFKPEDYKVCGAAIEDTCAIMYTSGSTGNPKGVMLSVKNFTANVYGIVETIPMRRGENLLSILPFAHIFGLTVDAITSLCMGMHLCVLGCPPIPNIVKNALMELKPHVFFAVPLVLSKFTEYVLGDLLKSEENKAKLDDYENNPEFCEQLRKIVVEAMGGNVEVFATGGAAIPPEVESLLAFKLKTPFITGYGMTECAPLISLGPIGKYKAKSCGQVPDGYAELKIDSVDPHKIPGEVLVKGDCVFAGYYKNETATKAVLSEDGWLHTGDVGIVDEENILFLSGRCKNMILTSNGQNVFPEEIEVVLNALPLVAESVVVQRETQIHAIIVPNAAAIEEKGLDAEAVQAIMKENIVTLNNSIPKYSSVSSFELHMEPFAKTPKGSIKRFMYM
ncbi:MAG: AMP-binding protein [Bacteroidales bacterium]|nr:AMP-binding protein [Bacteroidales bacterium]